MTVVIPDPQDRRPLRQLRKNRLLLQVKRMLMYQRGVVVASVPFLPGVEPEPERLQAPVRLALIVVVSAVHRATIGALEYARSLNPSELKAVTIATNPEDGARLANEWTRWGVDFPLEVVDSPYRSLIQPLLAEVRELSPSPKDAVGVVVPEFVVGRWWQQFLHNQTALLIKTALNFEPNVVVIDVPYPLSADKTRTPPANGKLTAAQPDDR